MLKYYTVAIHSLPLDALDKEHSSEEILAEDELARARTLQGFGRQAGFIATRAGLRKLLSAYTGIAPRDVRFTYGPDGKPELHNDMNSDIRFNVSHSGALAVYAFARGFDVGIDVEHVREVDNLHKIAGRMFASDEIQALSSTSTEDRSREFLKIWTKREALVKLYGSSIWRERDTVPPEVSWITFEPRAGYIGAVAAGAPKVYFEI